MTIEAIVMVTGMASKYDECGARVRMGASAGNALCPFTVIQWKPPANHMTRMMIFRIMSTSLEITDMYLWGTLLVCSNKPLEPLGAIIFGYLVDLFIGSRPKSQHFSAFLKSTDDVGTLNWKQGTFVMSAFVTHPQRDCRYPLSCFSYNTGMTQNWLINVFLAVRDWNLVQDS